MASSTHFDHMTVRQRLDLALSEELQEGEKIVWHGMKLARVEPKGFAIWLFAIPWTLFALFWMTMAGIGSMAISDLDGPGGIIGFAFPLFGLPFVLIGLGMMAMPFVPYMQRGRILFAVTDQRVLQLNMGRDLEVESIPSARIREITRRQSRDGSGSVEVSKSTSLGDLNTGRGNRMTIGRVDDVRGAYEAVLALSLKE